jgi:hypothetical protein
MSESAIELATQLLARDENGLADLRLHRFNAVEAHDDSAIERLYVDFTADFERAQTELSASYGEPSRTGTAEDKVIPLNGVFRFSVWEIQGRSLFMAAAHEDRGLPILLMLGTVTPDQL